MKKILALIMIVCLMLSLCGCTFLKDLSDSTRDEEPKTFEYDGISIELTTNFVRMDFVSEEYDLVIGNDDLTVIGVKAVLDDGGTTSAAEFAEIYRSVIEKHNPTEVTELDGIPTLQCIMKEDGEEDLKVATMFYKGSSCLWVVCFAADEDEFSGQYDDICKYAKTVKCD